MIHISIPEEFVDQIEKSALEEAAAVALQVGLAEAIHLSEHEKPNTKETDLSIVIDNDSKLQELNLQFRNVNTPTDVLAFPAFEKDPETEHTYLGDVIISFHKHYHRLNPLTTLLKPSFNCSRFMEYCTCWDTNMKTEMQRAACGTHKN